MAAFSGKVFAYAPVTAQALNDDRRKAVARQDFTAKPVQGPVDIAEIRKKVMARYPVVRAALAR